MRNLKKFLALVLAMMMVLSLMVTVNAATTADFSDGGEVEAEYKEALDLLVALRIIGGTNKGLEPNGTFDRGQLAALLYLVNNYDPGRTDPLLALSKDSNCFTDVPSSHWAASYINYGYDWGQYLSGVGGGLYNPDGTVTLAEVFAAMMSALNLEAGSWSNVLFAAHKYGLDEGIDTSDLSGPATRQAAAQAFFNAMKYTPNEGGVRYKVTLDDGTVNYFPTVLEAWLYVDANAGNNSSATVDTVDDTSGSILTDVHGVTMDSVTNELKETTWGWVKDGEVLVETGSSATSVYTYAGWYNTNTVYNNLKANGVNVTTWDTNATVYQNGSNDIVNQAPGTSIATVLTYYTNSVNNNIVKVYVNNENHRISKVVVINIFSAVLARGDFDNNEGTVTLKYPPVDPWTDLTADADGLAAGDVVTWNRGKNANGEDVAVNVQKVEGFTGTVSSITNPAALRPTYNIGGAGYVKSDAIASGKTLTLDVGSEGTWYLDELGHIICFKAADEETIEQYAIIDDISYADGSGAVDDSKYISARLVFVDGSTEVVKITAIKAAGKYYAVGATAPAGFNSTANGVWTNIVDTSAADDSDTISHNHITNAVDLLVKKTFFKYDVDPDTGYYTLTLVTTPTLTTTADIKAGSVSMTDGTDTIPVNSKTLFVVLNSNGRYYGYTGNGSVAKINSGAVVYYLLDENGVAKYVFVTGSINTNSDGDKVFILYDFAIGSTATKENGTPVTYYNYYALVNGELTIFTVRGSTPAGKITSGGVGLYTPTYNSSGAVTDMTKDSGRVIHGGGYSLSGGTLAVKTSTGTVAIACDDNNVPVYAESNDFDLSYTDELDADENDNIYVVATNNDKASVSYIVIFENDDDGIMSGDKEFFESFWPNSGNTQGVGDHLENDASWMAISWYNDGTFDGDCVVVRIKSATANAAAPSNGWWFFPIGANTKGIGVIALDVENDFLSTGGNAASKHNSWSNNGTDKLADGSYIYEVLVGTRDTTAENALVSADIANWTSISSGNFTVKTVEGTVTAG